MQVKAMRGRALEWTGGCQPGGGSGAANIWTTCAVSEGRGQPRTEGQETLQHPATRWGQPDRCAEGEGPNHGAASPWPNRHPSRTCSTRGAQGVTWSCSQRWPGGWAGGEGWGGAACPRAGQRRCPRKEAQLERLPSALPDPAAASSCHNPTSTTKNEDHRLQEAFPDPRGAPYVPLQKVLGPRTASSEGWVVPRGVPTRSGTRARTTPAS